MRIATTSTVLLAALFVSISYGSCRGDEPVGTPDPGVPELKVLARFAGTWEAKLGDSDNVIRSKRVWVLGGRFLKHEFSLSNGDLSGTIYRGYDQKQNRYIMTEMDSSGNASLLVGFWSDDRKTLTFESRDSSSMIQKYESYFPDEATEQWTISFRGGDGNTGEITGTARRKSE